MWQMSEKDQITHIVWSVIVLILGGAIAVVATTIATVAMFYSTSNDTTRITFMCVLGVLIVIIFGALIWVNRRLNRLLNGSDKHNKKKRKLKPKENALY